MENQNLLLKYIERNKNPIENERKWKEKEAIHNGETNLGRIFSLAQIKKVGMKKGLNSFLLKKK